jgi:hypothetical protein
MAQCLLGDRAPPESWQSTAKHTRPNANWGQHAKHTHHNETAMALLPAAAAIEAPQLEGIAAAINEELGTLHALFRTEFLPRALRIGQLLTTAKSIWVATTAFYQWAEETTGLSDRSVRNYLRLHANRDALQRLIDGTDRPPTSIDGCLALLRADETAGPDLQPTEDEVIRNRVRSTAATLKSTITNTHQRIAELDPQFLSAEEVATLEAAQRIADRAAAYAKDPSTVPPKFKSQLATNLWRNMFDLRAAKQLPGVTQAERVVFDRHLLALQDLLEQFEERAKSIDQPTKEVKPAKASGGPTRITAETMINRVTHAFVNDFQPGKMEILSDNWITESEMLQSVNEGTTTPTVPVGFTKDEVAEVESQLAEGATPAEPTTPSTGGLEGELPLGTPLADWSHEQLVAGLLHFGSQGALARGVINPATGDPYSKQRVSAVFAQWRAQGFEFPAV